MMSVFYTLIHCYVDAHLLHYIYSALDPLLTQIFTAINNKWQQKRNQIMTNPDHLTFSTNSCKTNSYQRSFLNRSTRLWNILPKKLTGKNISLTQVKSGPQKYQLAVKNKFDADNPRMWKSIFLSCNKIVL